MNNPSTVYLKHQVVNSGMIERLEELPYSNTGTRRICLHDTSESPLHVMLVESESNCAFPIHYHSDSDEVLVIISGQLKVVIWREGLQRQSETIILSEGIGGARAALIRKNTPHFTQPIETRCIYLETKLGPFRREKLVALEKPPSH
jgi:cupin fold WbuC family metalloprotein